MSSLIHTNRKRHRSSFTEWNSMLKSNFTRTTESNRRKRRNPKEQSTPSVICLDSEEEECDETGAVASYDLINTNNDSDGTGSIVFLGEGKVTTGNLGNGISDSSRDTRVLRSHGSFVSHEDAEIEEGELIEEDLEDIGHEGEGLSKNTSIGLTNQISYQVRNLTNHPNLHSLLEGDDGDDGNGHDSYLNFSNVHLFKQTRRYPNINDTFNLNTELQINPCAIGHFDHFHHSSRVLMPVLPPIHPQPPPNSHSGRPSATLLRSKKRRTNSLPQLPLSKISYERVNSNMTAKVGEVKPNIVVSSRKLSFLNSSPSSSSSSSSSRSHARLRSSRKSSIKSTATTNCSTNSNCFSSSSSSSLLYANDDQSLSSITASFSEGLTKESVSPMAVANSSSHNRHYVNQDDYHHHGHGMNSNANGHCQDRVTEHVRGGRTSDKVQDRVTTRATCSRVSDHPVVLDRVTDENGYYIAHPDHFFANDRFRILGVLGQGTFGKVIKAFDYQTNDTVAIKIIRAIPKYREASKIELRILTTLKNADPENLNNCIHLREVFDYENHICIVTDLLDISLFEFSQSNKFKPFPGSQIQAISRQLLRSVAFLHDLNLIHTDLKPENILLTSGAFFKCRKKGGYKKVLKNPQINIIDFGSAVFSDEYHSELVSTRHYRAPEIVLGTGWSFPCDIWSLGCILVELVTGEALFNTHENLEHLAIMEKVLGCRIPNAIISKTRPSSPIRKYFRIESRGKFSLAYPCATTTEKSINFVAGIQRVDRLICSKLKFPFIIKMCESLSVNWRRVKTELAGKTSGNRRGSGNSVSKGTSDCAFNGIDYETFQFWYYFIDLVGKCLTYDPDKRITALNALSHPWWDYGLLDEATSEMKVRK